MSIAAISSSFLSAVRDSAAVAAVDAVVAPRRSANEHREGGRRHDLVGAMNQVLGISDEQDPSDEQAVYRFAHALMHDLRSIDGGVERDGQRRHHEHDQGRGNAWGRREWNDLPQRLDALATAAGATPTPPAAAPTVPMAPSQPAPSTLSAQVPVPEVPPQPTPITTTSAALHLMQVPTSRLLEAYAALRQALGEQAAAPTSANTRADLASFLERLSDELAADAPSVLPTGSVLNLTA
jgi:hypothetical protein